MLRIRQEDSGSIEAAIGALYQQFGEIDIYLFDQLLRGRLLPGMHVLDAGCGYGRNLVYLLRSGFFVHASDADPQSVAAVRQMAQSLAPRLPATNFRVENIESMTHPESSMDFVVSNAVLHFARDDHHFNAMLRGMWRTVKPGGILFCRLASSIGMEGLAQQLQGRRYWLPDESERYLVDAPLLERLTTELGGELIDPLKTTVVDRLRSMTTWVLRKQL